MVTNRPPNLFRLLLAIEFLVALQVVFTFWSQVGGQSHLDAMFWPWKFGLSLICAVCIVGITVGGSRRRVLVLWALLAGAVLAGGVVTYYYHVNEPSDQEQDSTDQLATFVANATTRGTS